MKQYKCIKVKLLNFIINYDFLKFKLINDHRAVGQKVQLVNKTAITLGDVSEHDSFVNGACPVGLE